MGKRITLIRCEEGENGVVYKAEGASLAAGLGAFCVLGPGHREKTLRVLDETGWRKFYELNRKLSIEDNMALRKMLAPASKAELTEERLTVPQRLAAPAALSERCCLEQVDDGLWELFAE